MEPPPPPYCWPSKMAVGEGLVLLEGEEDKYDGVIINPECLPQDVPSFQTRLKASLIHWKSLGRKGIWLKLPIENANLVVTAVEEGFKYHHAEPSFVMMTYWIPESLSTIPPNASHQIGVGGFVINDDKEVLVVQEKNGPLRGSGVWKIPTGLVNEGEDIFEAAIREVKEETGVDTEFLEVVAFRHAHDVAFGKSDLFFVSILRPLSYHIVEQESEILEAKWMSLEELQGQDFYQKSRMMRRTLEIAISHDRGNIKGFVPELLHFHSKPSYLYSNSNDSPPSLSL